jgi:rSAM/selenodomain-associated transferase 1
LKKKGCMVARRHRGCPRRISFAPRLVIMAKSPVAGLVKRRLARDIGDVAATRIYRSCLSHTVLRLAPDPRWRTLIAVTPDTAMTARCWPLRSTIRHIPQGSGDLGRRMQRIFQRLPPGPAIIVGSDIPGIRATHIDRAFKHIGRVDAVFGPALDGGYWLIGLKNCPRRRDLFGGVRWSSAHALADTRANLPRKFAAFAQTLSDVDTKQDYRREARSIERLILPAVHRGTEQGGIT